MKFFKECLLCLASFILFFSFAIGYISNPSYELNQDIWWNTSWHYKIKIEINSTSYERIDWPIEKEINFTQILQNINRQGNLDLNSLRLFEYNFSGHIKYPVPYQFDQDENYNPSENAFGTLVFYMNGTTPANSKRVYYLYFDTLENVLKPEVSYSSNITYFNNTGEIEVNTTVMSFYIDTNRGQNVSGIYRIKGMEEPYNDIFIIPSKSENPIEYLRYSNGTHSFSFDLINNYTISGTLRLKVEQRGYETFWGTTARTNKTFVTKTYYFYDNKPWVKIEQKIINIDSGNITRNSTKASTLTFDVQRAFGSDYVQVGNSTEPFSWQMARDFWGTYHTGFINLNKSTAGVYADHDPSMGKIGLTLNSTSLQPGESIFSSILIHVNDTQADDNQITYLKQRYEKPVHISFGSLEYIRVELIPSTNSTIYNKGETILLLLNASYDPYNKTAYANATIDMGTPIPTDDVIIQLYDDGIGQDEVPNDNIFTSIYTLNESAEIGEWKINYTIFDSGGLYLNNTTSVFNVTDFLHVDMDIINPEGLVGRILNATLLVKNYRQDSNYSGATISCSCPETTIYPENITDIGYGSYFISFNAPANIGNFALNCSASKMGNFGSTNRSFINEPALTYSVITVNPKDYESSTITIYSSDNFTFSSNATNIGLGKMSFSNITLTLPSGWYANSTLENCGNITSNSSCIKGFHISIPNSTQPGEYFIFSNITWSNPDYSISSNTTFVNVTILPNPKINITQTSIQGNVGDGLSTNIGNFTVFSWGNSNLTNVTFSVFNFSSGFSFSFLPEKINSIPIFSSANVSVNVSVDFDIQSGYYSGIIMANSSENIHDNISVTVFVINTSHMKITAYPSYIPISGTSIENKTFEFTAVATNIGDSISRSANITISLPVNWTTNSTWEECGNLLPNESCSKGFLITAPIRSPPGNYTITSNITWRNPDFSISKNYTTVTAGILGNPLMEIPNNYIFSNVSDGMSQIVGNFTIFSIGNEELLNITFQPIGFDDITLSFDPKNISSIPINTNRTVLVNLTIPVTYPSGNYSSIVNVSAQNDGSSNITIGYFVLENRTWDMSTTKCQKVTVPYEGTACEIFVWNFGNTYINFTIFPAFGNHTNLNVTSLSLLRNETKAFNITYNVSDNPSLIYESSFTIDAIEVDASPDFKKLNVTLLPLVKPDVVVYSEPQKIAQGNNISIRVNVTDKTTLGVEYVKINVTTPDNITAHFNAYPIFQNSTFSTWEVVYPGISGNTTMRGSYFVSADVKDNMGNIGDGNATFNVYTKIVDSLSTLSPFYYQGDIGSIYYVARNISGNGIGGINVSFEVRDSRGNITYRETKSTGSDGAVFPLPTFVIPTDSIINNYTLYSNSTYYDDLAEAYVNTTQNTTFQVLQKVITVSGLFADLETAVVWYPQNVMRFGLLVYDGEGRPVDPESINLTVYDPAENLYLTVSKSSMSRETSGYYSYSYAMPLTTPTGMFLAYLNISNGNFQTQKLKAFRVASGGPYDVRVNLPKHEAYQGDYLDFEIVIENKGEVSQDVFLEYRVISENQAWFSKSEAVFTPALSNQSFIRNAYIFSNQPLGNYILSLKVTYDNVQPPIYANTSFTVLNRPFNITTTTISGPIYITIGGGGGATYLQEYEEWRSKPPLKSGISIISYREIVELAQGWNTTIPITVKNSGQTELANISLVALGIPLTWYSIKPESVVSLDPGGISVFLLEFSIPKDARLGDYEILISAVTEKASDKKTMKLTIYSSVETLLRSQIDRANIELEKLKSEIEVARRAGKNVNDVLLFVDEIGIQIRLAEQNLANKKYDEGLKNINNINNLLERARALLYEKLIVKKEAGKLIYVIPVILGSVIVLMLIFFFLYLRKRKEGKKISLPSMEKIKGSVRIPPPDNTELLKEKEKLKRMLDLLEREKREKIISQSVYSEMKKNIEDKIAKIDRKLK